MVGKALWETKLLEGVLLEEYLSLCATHYEGRGHKHHILPKSIWPEFEKCAWNIVNLSYKEHYRAHEILPQICLVTKDKERMLHAWHFMATDKKSKAFISVETFDILCRARSEALSKSQMGKKHTPERIEKVRQSQLGRNFTPEHIEKLKRSAQIRRPEKNFKLGKGDPLLPETCAKLSAVRKGVKKSDETRAKMSAYHKGLEKSLSNIPYLNEVSSKYSYQKYDKNMVLQQTYFRKADLVLDGFDYRGVLRCCQGKYKTSGGYKWKRIPKLIVP